MIERIRKRSLGLIMSGFAAGLLVGIGLLVGSWLTSMRGGVKEMDLQMKLNASQTDSSASLSMDKGAVSDGEEAV